MIYLILIFGNTTLIAADDQPAALWKALSTTKKDTSRVWALMNLGNYYMYTNSDSGVHFYREATKLSEELHFAGGAALGTMRIGEIYNMEGKKGEALRQYHMVEKILDSTGYNSYNFKIAFLSCLYSFYRLSLPDSSLYYGKLLVEAARQQKDKYQEAVALWQMAYSAYLTGNYPLALELNLRSLELFEIIKKDDFLIEVYFQIGMIFEAQENFQQALENFFKSYKLAAPTNDRSLKYIYMHLGVCYVGTNQLDSAMKYCSMALENSKKNKDKTYLGAMLKNIGVVYEKKGEDLVALKYYQMAISHNKAQNSEYLLGMDYITLAKYYLKKKNYDSSLYYANQASVLAHHSAVLKNIMDASDLLTKTYEAKNQIDSAYKYQGIRLMAKDSLFSQEKIRHVQFLSYKEEQRQNQIEEERSQALEERKKNLQLIGISVFIISFLLFVILLSKRRIKPRTIEFFGVISLLMLFEFINLFIHPYIEVLTHHSQIQMLMILVGIAAILVPMHHRMEKWVKQSLARKKMMDQESQVKQEELVAISVLADSKDPIK